LTTLAGLRIGAAVGHGATSPGTLGAFARDRQSRALGILSNNHVLAAANRGRPGDAIKMDLNGTITNIGKLERAIPLKEVGETDAAFALLSYDPEDATTITAQIKLTGATVLAKKDLQVWKRGSATGARSGLVRYAELPDIKVDYGTIISTFHGLIGIEPDGDAAFSESGDSGSLVVTSDGDALGLIIGGSSLDPEFAGLTLVTPIRPVLGLLDIELW